MKKKNSFTVSLATICLLLLIISTYWETIKTVLIVLFIGIIFLVFLKIITQRNDQISTSTQQQETKKAGSTSNLSNKLQNNTIKRQIDILTESIKLINDSNNLNTVIHRYSIGLDTLDKLNLYTDAELRAAGYRLKEPLSETLDFLQNNKISIINQAIERNIQHEIDALKTTNGKLRKADTLYHEMQNLGKLLPENIFFLESLYHDIKNNLSEESNDAK